VASIRGPWGQLSPKKRKGENLLMIKCIDSMCIWLWVSCCSEYIAIRMPRDLLNWCHCELCRQWCIVYIFVDIMLSTHKNRILLKNFRANKCCSARELLKEFYHVKWIRSSPNWLLWIQFYNLQTILNNSNLTFKLIVFKLSCLRH